MGSRTLTLRRADNSPHQVLALVGEAPGPRGNPLTPLWPDPPHMTGGKLRAMLDMSRTDYLRTFRRADLLATYPGPVFPLSQARALAAPLAQQLAPLPLVLLGRGVASAFSFPTQDICTWEDYLLDGVIIRAACIPHPSGRSRYYRDPESKAKVGRWLREQVEAHQAK